MVTWQSLPEGTSGNDGIAIAIVEATAGSVIAITLVSLIKILILNYN